MSGLSIGSLKLRSQGTKEPRKYTPIVLKENRPGWFASWGSTVVAENAPKGGDSVQDPACKPVGRLGVQESLNAEKMSTSSRYVVTQATSPPTVARVAYAAAMHASRQADAARCGSRHAIVVPTTSPGLLLWSACSTVELECTNVGDTGLVRADPRWSQTKAVNDRRSAGSTGLAGGSRRKLEGKGDSVKDGHWAEKKGRRLEAGTAPDGGRQKQPFVRNLCS